MKNNTTILLAIIAILVVATFIVMQKPGEKSLTTNDRNLLVGLDSTRIDKIEIKCKFGSYELVRQGLEWRVTKPVQAKADAEFIGTAINMTTNMIVKSIVSTNPEKQSVFEVDSSGSSVKIYEDGSLKAEFIVGKMGNAYDETYVRLAGSDEVALVNGSLTYLYGSPLRNWRDKTIFHIDQSQIASIGYRFSDEEFTLQQKDTAWTIDGTTVNRDIVNNLLRFVTSFDADDFLDTPPDTMPKITGFIDLAGVQLRFAEQADENHYLVQSSTSPQWFIVYKSHAESILKRKSGFFKDIQS